jgi:hypothetical protein
MKRKINQHQSSETIKEEKFSRKAKFPLKSIYVGTTARSLSFHYLSSLISFINEKSNKGTSSFILTFTKKESLSFIAIDN